MPSAEQIEWACALLRSDRKLFGFEGTPTTEAANAMEVLVNSRSEQAVFVLFELLLKHPEGTDTASWAIPYQIVRALKRLGTSAVLPLSKFLQSGNSKVRTEAIRLLWSLNDEQAYSFIIQALNDEEVDVRRQAVLAIGSFPKERARPLLLDLLHTEDLAMRCAAVIALSDEKYDEERTFLALMDMRNDLALHGEIIVALCAQSDERVVPVLLNAAQNENELELNARKHAIETLGKRREARVIPLCIHILQGADFYHGLFRSRTEESYGAPSSAAKALCGFGNRETLVTTMLANPDIETSTKLDALEALRHTRFRFVDEWDGDKHQNYTRDYRFFSVFGYCRKLLRRDPSPQVRQALEAILTEMQVRRQR